MHARWSIVAAANALLLFGAAQANHYLAPWSVAVTLTGLLLPFAGLRLPLRPALVAVLLSGLLHDALRPVAFGSTALLLGAALLLVHALRHKLPRAEVRTAVLLALAANTLLFFAVPLALPAELRAPVHPARLAVDWALSLAAVAALTPWFLALQRQALQFAGVHLLEEVSRLHGREAETILARRDR
jgi:hypothetical protein